MRESTRRSGPITLDGLMSIIDPCCPWGVVSAPPPSVCRHCGRPLVVPDGGSHYCPESWREAERNKVADAVKLLESKGYRVSPPSESVP